MCADGATFILPVCGGRLKKYTYTSIHYYFFFLGANFLWGWEWGAQPDSVYVTCALLAELSVYNCQPDIPNNQSTSQPAYIQITNQIVNKSAINHINNQPTYKPNSQLTIQLTNQAAWLPACQSITNQTTSQLPVCQPIFVAHFLMFVYWTVVQNKGFTSQWKHRAALTISYCIGVLDRVEDIVLQSLYWRLVRAMQ